LRSPGDGASRRRAEGREVLRKALGPGIHLSGREGFCIGAADLTALQLGLETAGPALFLVGLFLYAIAAAVFLPIPVEPFLNFYPEIDVVVKAVVLGLGKAVGAIAIFYIGFTVNRWLEGWMERHPRWAKILKFLERFVRRTRWFGLTILLSIPLMSDTAVNYFYSLLNEEGHSISRWQFVLANLVGGVARAYLWLWLVPLAVG